MGPMKELSIKLNETPLLYLIQEVTQRVNNAVNAELNHISTAELNALITSVELELMRRFAV